MVKIVHNKLLGGWYVVRGPHHTPISGRFNSKAEAKASLERRRELTVPEKHQLKIARDTLRMPDAMLGVMGGMTKAEAHEVIAKLTGKETK